MASPGGVVREIAVKGGVREADLGIGHDRRNTSGGLEALVQKAAPGHVHGTRIDGGRGQGVEAVVGHMIIDGHGQVVAIG